MHERLERAVARSADFLREAREDLRYAAIMASSDDQRRRAQSLSRAASKARELAGELARAWVAAQKSESRLDELRGLGLPRIPGTHRPPASIPPLRVWVDGLEVRASDDYNIHSLGHEGGFSITPHITEPHLDEFDVEEPRKIGGTTLAPRGGEQVTIFRGTLALQMPAATPPEVVDVLFSIATPLDLASDTVWPIESLAREMREIASDAGHNDETARATVSIHDVCRVLGIDARVHEPVDGEDVTRPATHAEFFAKLKGIREAMLVSLEAPWRAAKTIAGRLELAEDGLVSKLAERLGEVDPDWLAALVRESS